MAHLPAATPPAPRATAAVPVRAHSVHPLMPESARSAAPGPGPAAPSAALPLLLLHAGLATTHLAGQLLGFAAQTF